VLYPVELRGQRGGTVGTAERSDARAPHFSALDQFAGQGNCLRDLSLPSGRLRGKAVRQAAAGHHAPALPKRDNAMTSLRRVALIGCLAVIGVTTAIHAAEIELIRGEGSTDMAALSQALAAAGHRLNDVTVPGTAAEQHAALVSLVLGGEPPGAVILDMGRDAMDLARAGTFIDLAPVIAALEIGSPVDDACRSGAQLSCIPLGSGTTCGAMGAQALFFPMSDDPARTAAQYQLVASLFAGEIAAELGTGGFCTPQAGG
jgi:hypothetical protein